MVREISSRTLQMKRAEDLDFERLLLLFRDLDVTKMTGAIATKTHTYHCRNFWLSENIGLSICIIFTSAERTGSSILYSLVLK